MAIIHQSELSSYARCAEAYRIERTGIKPAQLSATAWGTCLHWACLEVFEQQYRTGTPFKQASRAAIDSFVHVWHPANISELTEPVERWLPRQTWAGLLSQGQSAIRWYAEWSKDAGDDELLATEYSFQVDIPGTWDVELQQPHKLAGTIDRLSFQWFKRYPTVRICDLKSGRTKTYLRHSVQFSAYCLATTQESFWTGGGDGEDGFGEERGKELFGRFKLAYRRADWVSLRDLDVLDAGFRGEKDYARFAVAAGQLQDAIKLNNYPLSLSGEVCMYCSFRDQCAGIGLPDDMHGSPRGEQGV